MLCYQAMLRRSYLTRAQEERIRSDNRKREYEVEDRAKMIAQDRLLRYVESSVTAGQTQVACI